MNEATGLAAVGMAVIANMATWLKIVYDKKKQNGNNPGSAKICIERGEKIAKIETEVTNFKEAFNEIKGDIKEIRRVVSKKKA